LTRGTWDNLLDIVKAMEVADAAKLRKIAAEERDVHLKIAALDAKHERSKKQSSTESLQMRRLGRELRWQQWVAKRRRDLQMQLARTLARKGMAQQALKRSFGRCAAINEIQIRAQNERERQIERTRIDNASRYMVLQRSADRDKP
jgi:hypothetical protein